MQNIKPFPTDHPLSGLLYNNEFRIFRETRPNRCKEILTQEDSLYHFTLNEEDYTLGKSTLQGYINRINGNYETRIRILPPFDNYEVNEQGRVFRHSSPETEIGLTDYEFYKLYETNTSKRYRPTTSMRLKEITLIEIVTRFFISKDTRYRDLTFGFFNLDRVELRPKIDNQYKRMSNR